jgi:hypothetical protein
MRKLLSWQDTPWLFWDLVKTPDEDRDQADQQRILDYYQTIAPSLDDERAAIGSRRKGD